MPNKRPTPFVLAAQMAAAGKRLGTTGPTITDFPIWLAAATGTRALALPAESPASVVDLARTFGGNNPGGQQ